MRTLLFFAVLFLFLAHAAGSGGTCSTGINYTCPNCGGYQVEDCLNCDGYFSTDQDHEICFNRRLFQPNNVNPTDYDNHYHYLWNDIVAAFVWFIMAGVATACGVGGGGIYVPLGILLLQFSPKQASGLSQASIFGASLGGLLLNSRDRHPEDKIRSDSGVVSSEKELLLQKKNTPEEDKAYEDAGNVFYTRPLIDFDMALFLSPMEMAGAVLGVLIQKMLPNWLYLTIAGIVLSFTAYKTFKKFLQARKKEKRQEGQADASVGVEVSAEKDVELEENVENGSGPSDKSEQEKIKSDTGKETLEEEHVKQLDEEQLNLRKDYLKEDMRQYPKEKILALIVLWIGLFLLTLFKGGKGVKSLVGINCTSPWYGVLIALQFLWMFGFAIFFGLRIVKKQATRLQVKYPYLPDDPVWNPKSLRFYGIFTFIAGIVAGLIGIGGGMVLGPLMLVMGIHPRVSSATTATMIVLTSSSVAVIFVTSGLVPWSYAVFYFFICLIGAIIGKSQIDGYVKRTGRASILIFILATIIAFATIGCFVIMFIRLADKEWCFDGFNKFCNVETGNLCGITRLLGLKEQK
mmetsp:Transcript_18538/g.27493  ORF Transcript_18538/g.27493 Transcript_18538/m.27493 type:complete len:575 (-) Transcript_18538:113-1837(-)